MLADNIPIILFDAQYANEHYTVFDESSHLSNVVVQSTNFGHVRHVRLHIWSSTGKAADTQFAVSQNPT